MYEGYLPISKQDMIDRGIEQLDFVYVCGDAYVDHPSFGHAIIARLLEAHGYSVGIIHSRTGRMTVLFPFWVCQGLDFLCQQEIWIPW